MYEGEEAYAFISYSHKDREWLLKITEVFKEHQVRFWYDNGLRSGDDWNLVLASHLEKAAACLLLLSSNSANSIYVKNELNFAINHRIPVHAVLLEHFSLPLDVEMMLGRIQMLEAGAAEYQKQLLKALPPELYAAGTDNAARNQEAHPLFEISRKIGDCRGAIAYLGKHRRLNYPCLIHVEPVKAGEDAEAWNQVVLASGLKHPMFPRIYDVHIEGNQLWVYQEYRGERFLDQFLQGNKPSGKRILEWVGAVIDAMEYLFQADLGLRDIFYDSLVVLDGDRLGMIRPHSLYYGVFELKADTKPYYLEKEIQAVGLLLAQLCTGSLPVSPVPLIKAEHLNAKYLEKFNLIIQKSAGKSQYASFVQLREDLAAPGVSLAGKRFLRQRAEELRQYERKKSGGQTVFTGGVTEGPLAADETLVINDAAGQENAIKLLICSTGELRRFSKSSVTIGRSLDCDLVLSQRTVSRHHAKIERVGNQYKFQNLSTTNGSYLSGSKINALPGESVTVSKEDYIQIGSTELKIV